MAITRIMLKRLRIEAGLTQKALAELVGVSQAHIAKIEQGKVVDGLEYDDPDAISSVAIDGSNVRYKEKGENEFYDISAPGGEDVPEQLTA